MTDLIIISASGFGIDEADNSSIHQMHKSIRDTYQGVWPQAEIVYRPWDAAWHHIARRLHKTATSTCPTVFLGHSYGCGWGLKRFEQEWRRKGRTIDFACLIDPVPRAFNLFFIGNLFALTHWGVVRTRSRHILLFRQVNDTPHGRPVKLKSPNNQEITQKVFGSAKNLAKYASDVHLDERVVDDYVTHTSIDGHAEVAELFFKRLEAFLGAFNV
jgi:hypothetical protein